MAQTPLVPSAALLADLESPRSALAGAAAMTVTYDVPNPLRDFLAGLQHLANVPFTYLVADPAQLPPESLRFFHLDPNWQRALVEGALSAASAGTADDDERLDGFRDAVFEAVAALPGGITRRVTGMLLRSAIVRYHPKLMVRAYTTATGNTLLPTVRFARLSQNILLVLWQGVPARVELEEPRSSAWYGVDRTAGGALKLEQKNASAVGVNTNFDIALRAGDRGVVDIAALATDIAAFKTTGAWAGPAGAVSSVDLGLHLQQTPYLQVFKGSADTMPVEDPVTYIIAVSEFVFALQATLNKIS